MTNQNSKSKKENQERDPFDLIVKSVDDFANWRARAFALGSRNVGWENELQLKAETYIKSFLKEHGDMLGRPGKAQLNMVLDALSQKAPGEAIIRTKIARVFWVERVLSNKDVEVERV